MNFHQTGTTHNEQIQQQLEELWTQFSLDLKKFISRRVRQHDDVEDILQIVFLRMTTGLGQVRESEALLGWMYALTRNVIIDYYRAARHHREQAVSEVPEPASAADDDDEAREARAELARCLRPMLSTLPPEQADGVRMVDFDGMTHAGAASVAGVTVSGMKSRVQRGRARLHKNLLACCQVSQDASRRVFDYSPRQNCACGDERAH